jgi:hypothetical protein
MWQLHKIHDLEGCRGNCWELFPGLGLQRAYPDLAMEMEQDHAKKMSKIRRPYDYFPVVGCIHG